MLLRLINSASTKKARFRDVGSRHAIDSIRTLPVVRSTARTKALIRVYPKRRIGVCRIDGERNDTEPMARATRLGRKLRTLRRRTVRGGRGAKLRRAVRGYGRAVLRPRRTSGAGTSLRRSCLERAVPLIRDTDARNALSSGRSEPCPLAARSKANSLCARS